MQKYSNDHHRRDWMIPLRIVVLIGATMSGLIIEWIAQLTALQLLIWCVCAVGACIVCVKWGAYRSVCILACSILIGMMVGSRLVHKSPIVAAGDHFMISWLDGTVEEVLRISQGRMQCIVEGVVDPKYLQPRSSIRLLLRCSAPQNLPMLEGARVVGTVKVRLPRARLFPTDWSEWQYCISREVQLVVEATSNGVAFLPSSKQYHPIRVVRHYLKHLTSELFRNNGTSMLVQAMVLGDRETLSYQTARLFSRTGTVHLLAISGFHVGLIAAGIFILAASLPHGLLRLSTVVTSVWFYVLLTGASPPAMRAGLAITIALLILHIQRWATPVQAVLLVLWALVMIEPVLLLSVSFQLSASAVLGIVILLSKVTTLFPAIMHRSHFHRWTGTIFATTLGASLATAPFCAYYFGFVAPITLLANVCVVPIASAFIGTSLVALVAGMISLELGRFYALVGDWLSTLMLGIIEIFASFEWSIMTGREILPFVCGLLISIWYVMHARTSKLFLTRLIVSIAVVFMWWQLWYWSYRLPRTWSYSSPTVHVTFQQLAPDIVSVTLLRLPERGDDRQLSRALAEYCLSLSCKKIYIEADNNYEHDFAQYVSRYLDVHRVKVVIHG